MMQLMPHTAVMMHQSARWPRAKSEAPVGSRVNFKVLRLARQIARLTQQELADRVGVNIAMISRLEAGRGQRPSYLTIVRLARALNVPVDELFPVEDYTPTANGDAA
jgi:DNA-binding XRE family transcriptional regulator